ncbi:MAG: hypothetical protein AAFY02_12855 [Pseudomonadota bacterium]
MTYKINPADKHLVEEFKAKPIGHHSQELQRLMNFMRGQPQAEKYVLVCTKPHEEWVLAQLPTRRGHPLKMHHNRVFTSIEEAEWEVFKMRWHHYTGETLED